MQSSGEMFPIEKSSLYQLYLLEKHEIEKHKWFLSEKAGYDVGYSYAAYNWNWNHRTGWLAMIKSSGQFSL